VTEAIDDANMSDMDEEMPPAKKSRPETASAQPEAPAPKPIAVVNDPFYGFLPSEVPKRTVIVFDDGPADLTAPFDPELLSAGDDLTPEDVGRQKKPSIVVSMSSVTSQPKASPEPKKPVTTPAVTTPAVTTPAVTTPTVSAAMKPLPGPMVRESREWKPSAQFFKPLAAGDPVTQTSYYVVRHKICVNTPSTIFCENVGIFI
jgi:hypothetical protein